MLHALVALTLMAASGAPHRAKLAVLDVQDVAGNESARAKLLSQVLVGDLPKLGEFDVVGSSEIRSMLGFERQRKLLGCQDDSCLAEIGGALGVDYLVIGQLGKLGSRYRFDLRLVKTSRSTVVASEGDFIAGNDDALAEAVEKMLVKLIDDAGLGKPKSEATTSVPAGGLSEAAPTASHTAAWITAGGAVALAAGAVLMTLSAQSTYRDAQACYARSGTTCGDDDASLSWKGPLADGLWVGAAALAGASTYLFLRGPDAPGAGGEIGLRGSF